MTAEDLAAEAAVDETAAEGEGQPAADEAAQAAGGAENAGAEQAAAGAAEGAGMEDDAGEPVEGEPVDDDAGDAGAAAGEGADALAAAKAEAAELRDRYARLQAEWDNFRKRTAAERTSERARAAEKLVTDLLPALDDMDRAIAHAKDTGDGSGLVEGVEAILGKFLQILEKHQVSIVPADGEPFDAMKHQAVGTQEDESVPEETVVQVYQKGYQMGDRVIRPAMVVTSTGGPAREAEATGEEE